MSLFAWASLAGMGVVVVAAGAARGRQFALFAAVLLGLHTAVSSALAPAFAWCLPVYAYLQAAVYLHFLLLVRARMRPLAYRLLVSVPASWFVAGTFLALPWALAAGFGLAPPPPRHPPGAAGGARPLRVVQITDPHLGPFMSERRLRRLCERAVAQDPDLVFLTGDFLTMESHGDHLLLARALEPLSRLEGRVFACRGNHDHEAPETVARALELVGARLLIDDATHVETPAGPVQIVGMDFHWRDRARKMADVCRRHPRREGHLRVVLLHDPGAFRHLPEGEGDLVLAGHTHGGQLGLLSVGLPYTIVSAFGVMPDHGLWARGVDRLYVHRGTGHYGFPLRVGVPSEESLLRVHVVG